MVKVGPLGCSGSLKSSSTSGSVEFSCVLVSSRLIAKVLSIRAAEPAVRRSAGSPGLSRQPGQVRPGRPTRPPPPPLRIGPVDRGETHVTHAHPIPTPSRTTVLLLATALTVLLAAHRPAAPPTPPPIPAPDPATSDSVGRPQLRRRRTEEAVLAAYNEFWDVYLAAQAIRPTPTTRHSPTVATGRRARDRREPRSRRSWPTERHSPAPASRSTDTTLSSSIARARSAQSFATARRRLPGGRDHDRRGRQRRGRDCSDSRLRSSTSTACGRSPTSRCSERNVTGSSPVSE